EAVLTADLFGQSLDARPKVVDRTPSHVCHSKPQENELRARHRGRWFDRLSTPANARHGFARRWPSDISIVRMIRLTTRRVCYTVLALHLFLVLIAPIYDPDVWWHLRTGQYIFQTLRVPRTDIYSFTVFGKPWFAPEWLSEAAMYGIYL